MLLALLIDTTRCIGCRGCQTTCKQWWELPGWGDAPEEYKTSFNPTLTNPTELNSRTYNHIDFREVVDEEGKLSWNFVSKRCFHCLEPACVSVCPVAAMQKFPDGPVAWDGIKCIGCRYCQMACPFDIPKFEWDKNWPKIAKCWFCWDRLQDGLQPSCAKTCPPSAIEFGIRDSLLAEAHRRIEENPEKYVNHVYGENEAGGTSLLYLAAVPFEKLGFKSEVKQEFYPEYTWEFLSKIPVEIVAIAAAMAGTWYFRKKRLEGNNNKEIIPPRDE